MMLRCVMKKEIVLAGGCFWGMEKYLSLIPGVVSTQAGYVNGKTQNPTYEQVCEDNTGFAEAVRVQYEDSVLPLSFLLTQYFNAVDPTSHNRQGGDIGTQYRTGIYYRDEEDRETGARSLSELQSKIGRSVCIELLPLRNYYAAEEYHQKYLEKNPNGYCHIGPAAFDRARRAVFTQDTE